MARLDLIGSAAAFSMRKQPTSRHGRRSAAPSDASQNVPCAVSPDRNAPASRVNLAGVCFLTTVFYDKLMHPDDASTEAAV
jgi:hypothetical protein